MSRHRRVIVRTALLMTALVASLLAGPAGAVPASAAAAANGPWIVDITASVHEIDRRQPVPPRLLLNHATNASASPDGRYVAFTPGSLVPPYTTPNLWVYDRRDATVRQVTSYAGSPAFVAWPTWSPDSRRIALTLNGDLYLVDVATGAMTLRLDTGREIHKPAWSPDGRSIAFTMQDELGALAIHLVRVGSGRVQRVLGVAAPGELLHDPIWTPDSKRILFVSSRWTSEPGLRDLGEVEPDGSDLRRLTTTSRFFLSPVFSPDGAKLAVLSIPEENTEPDGANILVFPADFSRSWWIPGDEYDDSVRLSWAPPAA